MTERQPLRWRRAALTLAGIVAGLLVVAVIALVVLTETDWGREQARRRIVSFVEARGEGRMRIGRVTGNLRRGISMHDVTITDTAGQPFVAAREITARYRLLDFLRRRVYLHDVLLVDAVVLLDRQPDGRWNYDRIFPRDTIPVPVPQPPGWGDWIRFTDARIVNGHVVVRSPWEPSEDFSPAQRDSVIRDALAGGSRMLIIPAALGGYQQVIELRELHATIPVMHLRDPARPTSLIDVETLRTDALPFRPPAAELRDVAGRFHFDGDSLWWRGIDVTMPGSELFGDGAYHFEDGDMWIAAFGRPLSLADIRWVFPRAPSRGGGPVDFLIRFDGGAEEYLFRNADIRVDNQRVTGDIGVIVTDTIAIRGADLRLSNVDTRLLEQVIAGFDAPRSGIIDGRLRANGGVRAMRVDADLAFNDRLTGLSRVAAVGEIGMLGDDVGDGIRARNLRLRLLPLRVELVRAFFPEIPVGGVLTGSVALDGATTTALAIQGDVRHDDAGMTSQVAGRASVRLGDDLMVSGDVRLHPLDMDLVRAFMPDVPVGGVVRGQLAFEARPGVVFAGRGELRHEEGDAVSDVAGSARVDFGRVTRVNADLVLRPLDLRLLAGFAPDAGLRGTARGPIRVTGTTSDLRVATELTLHDGSHIAGEGRFALAGHATRYDFSARLRDFDLNAAVAAAPSTSLTGVIAAQGAGIDPATMNARVAADLRQFTFENMALDSLVFRGVVADGLATVERGIVRGHDAVADVAGSFGLRRDRHGELRYRVAMNTIAPLDAVVPGAGAPGAVEPRPGFTQTRLEQARQDSIRIAAATEVERAATGAPLPSVPVDTPRAIPRAALSGALFAAGTLRGNIHDFDADGRAAGENLVIRGHSARQLRAEFAWRNARSPRSALTASVVADDLTLGGFAFDELDGRINYADRRGVAAVAIRQGDERDYAARGEFILSPDMNRLLLADAVLRFDTTFWRTAHPAEVRWGGAGIDIVDLDLRDQGTGRIYVDGTIPRAGTSELRVAVEDLDVGHITDMLQTDTHLRGILNLQTRVSGTLASPVMTGAVSLADGEWDGTAVPPVRGTFAYANETLSTHLQALRETGVVLAVAEGDIPINLALADVEGTRFPDRPMRLDVTADSLPIDLLPHFTDAVDRVSGVAMGRVVITGRLQRPNLVGAIAIDDARGRIAATGVEVRDVHGLIRMLGDSVVIDSLVGWAEGPIRVTGGLAVGDWREPTFNLFMVAENATILDNELGTLRADGAVSLLGPFRNAYLSGQMAIRTGVIYLPESETKEPISAGDPMIFNVLDTAVVRDRELLPETSPLMRNLRMDVDITIDRTTWVRSRDANIEIFTDDRLQVSLLDETFRIIGIVNTDRGEYQYLSRRFQVRRGSAIFIGAPEMNPTLQLTAEYEVRLPARPAINIRVVIGGTMRRPRVSLESDAQPPIPQSDILSYLAFGRESGSLLNLDGTGLAAGGTGSATLLGVSRFAAQRLATLAVGIGLQEAEFQWGRQLGLDVFNVRPAEVPLDNFGEAALREFLMGTEIEAGIYVNPYTFVAVQGSLAALQGRGGPQAPPGIRLQHRTGHGWRFEPFIEPRFLPQEPTLSVQRPVGTSAFGVTIVREWRF